MRIYWIDEVKNGRLGIMARPRGNDWLEDEIRTLNSLNVNLVVSLLEDQEQQELEIIKESELCAKYGIDIIRFPIKDRGVPSDEKTFNQLIGTTIKYLDSGKYVVVHCRMGIGRASLLAGRVLINQGQDKETIFAKIEKYRGVRVPDTEEQINWMKNAL